MIPNVGTSIADMATALLARAPARFALLGHSLGGYVSLHVALRAPDRAAGLVLVSTSARGEPDAGRAARAGVVAAARDDPEATFARLARASLARANRSSLAAGVEAMLRAGGIERFAREQGAAGSRSGTADRLAEIVCPTLVITGADDAVVPTAASDELVAGITGAALLRIPDCGHMPQIEAGAPLRRALGTIMAKLTD